MKIVWTDFALNELMLVFDYYSSRVGQSVARNIKRNAVETVSILKTQPFVGQKEELLSDLELGHRYLVSGNYKIIYRIKTETIYITDFFDTRQKPEKMRIRHEKNKEEGYET